MKGRCRINELHKRGPTCARNSIGGRALRACDPEPIRLVPVHRQPANVIINAHARPCLTCRKRQTRFATQHSVFAVHRALQCKASTHPPLTHADPSRLMWQQAGNYSRDVERYLVRLLRRGALLSLAGPHHCRPPPLRLRSGHSVGVGPQLSSEHACPTGQWAAVGRRLACVALLDMGTQPGAAASQQVSPCPRPGAVSLPSEVRCLPAHMILRPLAQRAI